MPHARKPPTQPPPPAFETGDEHVLPPLDNENPGDLMLTEQFEADLSGYSTDLSNFAPEVGAWDQHTPGVSDPEGIDVRGLPGASPVWGVQGQPSSPPVWREAQKFPAATALRVWRMHNGSLEICGNTRHAGISEVELYEQFLEFMPKPGDPPLRLHVRPVNMTGQEFGNIVALPEIPWQNTDLQEVRRRVAARESARAATAPVAAAPGGPDPIVAEIIREAMQASRAKEAEIMAELRAQREQAARREAELAKLEAERQIQLMRAHEAVTESALKTETSRAEALLQQQARMSESQMQLQAKMHETLLQGQGGLSAALLTMHQAAAERERAAAEQRAREERERYDRDRREMEARLQREREELDRREAARLAMLRQEQEERHARLEEERRRMAEAAQERAERAAREAKAEELARQQRHEMAMAAMRQEHEARMERDKMALELQLQRVNVQNTAAAAASPLGMLDQVKGLLAGVGVEPADLLKRIFAPPEGSDDASPSAGALIAEVAPHIGGIIRGVGDAIQKARVPVTPPAAPMPVAALPMPVPQVPFPGMGAVPGGAMVLGELPASAHMSLPAIAGAPSERVVAEPPPPPPENADLAALPLHMKRDARTRIRDLVNKMRNVPEEQWAEIVVNAMQNDVATFYHYIKANGGLSVSLREAGADAAFIQRFLAQPAVMILPEDVPR